MTRENLKQTSISYEIRDLHFDDGRLWVVGLGFVPFYLSEAQRIGVQRDSVVALTTIVDKPQWSRQIGSWQTWAIDTDDEGNAWFGLNDRHAYFDGMQLHVTWQDTSVHHEYFAIAAFNKDSVFWGSQTTGLIFQSRDELVLNALAATYIMATTDTSTYFLTTQELLELKKRDEISVQSQLGVGTTFSLLLPVHADAAEFYRFDALPRSNGTPGTAEVPVLEEEFVPDDAPLIHVIEDHSDVMEYIRRCLIPGYRVTTSRMEDKGLKWPLKPYPMRSSAM